MSIRATARALATTVLLLAPTYGSLAAAPEVVASIRPLHSLVAAVMKGVGEPRLLVDSAQSPHAYALRPSDAAALTDADVVFWVGPHYEAFLTDTLPQLASGATIIAADDVKGLKLLPNREGGAFEPHVDGHDHEAAGHEAAGHEAAGHDEAGHEGHDHSHDHGGEEGHDEAGHDHGEFDPHVWLSPANAAVIVQSVATDLAKLDPENAAAYESNAKAEVARIEAAAAQAREILAPDAGKGFVVTHDGFQYFEDAFGPRAVGSVTVNPDVTPSALRVSQIKAKIAETGTACLVSEPQFPQSLMGLFLEENSRVAALDYIGIDHAPGPDLYTDLMVENARKLHDCLSG